MRPQGNPHEPRGNLRSDLEATRTDLEATCTDLVADRNDRKRAISHPRRQRRISLHKLLPLCFLWCGIACFLSLRPASRSVRVASRSYHGLSQGPCGLPRGPIVGCLEVRAGCLEVSSRVASRSHVRVASRSQGTNFETKIFNSRWFFGPSDRNNLHHTPILSKM